MTTVPFHYYSTLLSSLKASPKVDPETLRVRRRSLEFTEARASLQGLPKGPPAARGRTLPPSPLVSVATLSPHSLGLPSAPQQLRGLRRGGELRSGRRRHSAVAILPGTPAPQARSLNVRGRFRGPSTETPRALPYGTFRSRLEYCRSSHAVNTTRPRSPRA